LDLKNPDNFHIWERVFDRVREGEMPPDSSLDKTETTGFLDSLYDVLENADSARIKSAGRVPARRLTRSQYERNVCGLLAIDIPLREYLPEDSLTNVFDTVSKSQQVSDHSMFAYLKAADVALSTAFDRVLSADVSPPKVRLNWNHLRRNEERGNREPEGRPKHKDIVSWSTSQNFYGRMAATTVTETGRYRIRFLAHAVNEPEDGRVWCSIKSGACNARASTLYWIGSFEAIGEQQVVEFEAWIKKGHQIQIRPRDRGLRRVSPKQVGRPAGTMEPLGVPGVAIKWIEMQLIESDRLQIKKALIGDLEILKIGGSAMESNDTDNSEAENSVDHSTGDKRSRGRQFEIVSESPKEDLEHLIQSFAQRAFRRPVKRDELAPYYEFALKRLEESGTMRDALTAAYRAVLCSSRFLYFEEAPGVLDEHALANRLSHFLWGKEPDAELLRLASSGTLSHKNVLREQTDRMLKDPRSAVFINEFTDQWLMLHELNSTTPDGKLYPEYDDILHHSLRQESQAFVGELIAENLAVTNVVDSDFTFLNSRLARHYGIEWPGGFGMQRVELNPDDQRGGIISQASVMKVTANGTTTSPIIRGVWMLERIMGQHVPPPPSNVPAVEPDIRGATTIRDQLDKHRSLASCAACHVKIDPPGFALENFDVIGGWRDNYRVIRGKEKRNVDVGPAIDPSHQLTSGESFANLRELKLLLLKNPQPLARNIASQFVTYATGAAPTFADRETLNAIVAATKASNYGVRSLLHEVIQSPLFRNK
jgi:hypothetical protein